MDVYYRGFQSSKEKRREAGIPVKLEKEFSYGGYRWYVPAVYCCPEGVVIDVLRQIPMEEVNVFLEKWEETAMQYEDREDLMPEELRLLAEKENPYSFPVKFSVELNGQKIRELQWSGEGYGGRYSAKKLKPVLEEYGYDLRSAWYLSRISCGWPGENGNERGGGQEEACRKKSVRSLKLTVGTNRVEIPCNCRFRTKPGCEPMKVIFRHPSTGEEGEVKVLSCTPEKLDWSYHKEMFARPGEEELIYPDHFLRVNFQVSLDGEFRVKDTTRGDSAIRKSEAETCEGGPAAVGVIGGKSGPVAAGIVGKEKSMREMIAFSALHFHPVEEVEWILTVHEKLLEPIEVVLT